MQRADPHGGIIGGPCGPVGDRPTIYYGTGYAEYVSTDGKWENIRKSHARMAGRGGTK